MPRRIFFPASLLSVLLLLFVPALTGKPRPKPTTQKPHKDYSTYVEIPGASKVGADQCTQCHGEVAKLYRRSSHSLREVDCEQCHGAGSLHVEAGGYSKESKDKIVSFRGRTPEEANGACLSCHSQSDHVRNWFSSAHAAQDLKCTSCHMIHTPEGKGDAPALALTSTGETAAPRPLESRRTLNNKCLQCHRKQEAQADLPYHHPIREGKITCVDCHDPHGGSAGNNLITANKNELCFQCHAEYQGPFSYQHAPVNEDCMKCHSPHGSPNQNLLAISQPALCLQCHSAHHNGASLPLVDRCTNCHNAIHGSDISSATGGSKFIDK
jgi:DmsE family decaheme c-type cytochrome